MPLPMPDMCRAGSMGRLYWDYYAELQHKDMPPDQFRSLISRYLAVADIMHCSNFRTICLNVDSAKEAKPDVEVIMDFERSNPVKIGTILNKFKDARQLVAYLCSDTTAGITTADIMDRDHHGADV